MKKILLLSLTLFVGFSAFAQGQFVPMKNEIKTKSYKNVPIVDPAFELHTESVPVSDNIVFRGSDFAGSSTYDLQSNSTLPNRVVNMGVGNVLTSWTFANTDPALGVTERGTGFRMQASDIWTSAEPSARIENERCGWPATNVTSGGMIVNTSHNAGPGGLYNIVVSRRPVDGGDWTSAYIPTAVPNGALWPRSAVGGSDGNTVHAIAVTTPEAFTGAPYGGLDGHVLYYRSQDEGATWDVQDFIIPGLDSVKYAAHDIDQYSISANGNTVAVALYSTWNDLKVFISRDNGDTWEEKTVLDFPLKNYVLDSGYTSDQLPEDPNQPIDEYGVVDSLAIYSNDGTGEVVVDNDGTVHLTYAEVYVTDADLADGGWSFYPGYDAVYYWNETMDSDAGIYVGGALDMNGDSVLNVNNTVNYGGSSVSTHPELGYDDDGNLYISYASYNELYASDTDLGVRHIFLSKSTDGGQTWSETPRNLVDEDEDMTDFAAINYEFFYPAMANYVDDQVHILVQIDDYPGSYVQSLNNGPSDDISGDNNFLYYGSFQADPDSGTDDVDLSAVVSVFPNPASDRIILKTDFDFSNAQVSLLNSMGQKVYVERLQNRKGVNYLPIDVASFATGTYFLNIVADNNVHTQTIIVE